MEHRIEVAPSGRASCRTCGASIAKGELRLGEEYASQFGDGGVAIRWHHLACAAKGKLAPLLREAMASYAGEIPDREALEAAMESGKKPSAGTGALPSADLAPTGRAKCLQCAAAIAKGSVRIAIEREVDTGAFVTKGAGYLHPGCCEAWAASGWEAGLDDLCARVRANTGLGALPPPFGDATPEALAAASEGAGKTKRGRAQASPTAAGSPPDDGAPEAANAPAEGKAKSVKAARAATTDAAPPFGALGGKQVASIVAKLAKLDDDYKGDSILDKAGVEWGERDRLRWHIARHALLEPSHPTLLHRLAESTASASADEVFAVVPRLGAPQKKQSSVDLLPGWSLSADRIVLRAEELDPARLEGLLADAPPALRRGIQCVRGRSGATLPDADRAEVLSALATAEAKDHGLPRSYGQGGTRIFVQGIAPEGKRSEPFATSLELARCFGTEAEWNAALAKAAHAAAFGTIEHVLPGLATMGLDEMVALLAKPHFSSGEQHDRQVAALLDRRGDAPIALAQAALAIGREDYPGMYIREQLLVHAIGRMGERGVAIPEGLEREPKWDGFAYCLPPWRGSSVMRAAYRKALGALSRERVLALTEPLLARTYGQSQVLPFLAVQFDEGIARALVAGRADQGLADPHAFGPLGAPAIPLLVPAIDAPAEGADAIKRRDALVKCLRAVLGFIGATGGSFDASLDRFVSCSPEESYWPEESKAILLHSLRAMPEDRRIATAERLLGETKQIERAFFAVSSIEDPSFRERAARALVKGFGHVQERHTLQTALKSMGAGGLASFRAALLEERPDPKIFEDLRFCFGHAEVDAIMKAAAIVEETKLARLLRLAKEELAARPDAPHERIYLLERADLEEGVPARRAGSFSTSRGSGPGKLELAAPSSSPAPTPGQTFSLDQVLAMKKRAARTSEDEEHILTLDLEEIPELARRFPGARAVSLRAPFPEVGDSWEKARLVPVPPTGTAPADGTAISIVPLDVPSAIFDHALAREDARLKEIRGLVFNRPGYVLGEPMFIQDDDGDGPGFVMQLGDRIGDLNLGDSGSLYVFEGATFMQCY